MSLLITLITFLAILAVLIFFHELGHFSVAKLLGMRVDEFALGFGRPKLRLYHDGQTEYTLRAFPIGGFVRIHGMEIENSFEEKLAGGSDKKDDNDSALETTNISLLREEAAEVDHAEPDGFNSRPVWQRFLVILAGPVFSVLLGWLMLSLMGSTVGLPIGPVTSRIAAVLPDGPAAKAGLKAGDLVVAVDGAPMQNGEEMIALIHRSAGKALRLTVQSKKDLTNREVTVTPKAGEVEGKTVGLIGIQPENQNQRVSLARSFGVGTAMTREFFLQLFQVFKQAKFRENLGGPVAIFQGTKQSVDMGGAAPLFLAAQLSLSLGFFNLLPIPILDGGHLALLTLEAIRRRKLTAEQTQRVFTAGLAIIALLFVYIMFNDISKIFRKG